MKKILISLGIIASAFTFAMPAQAQLKGDAFTQFQEEAFSDVYDVDSAGKLEETLPAAIGRIISVFLSFIGVILLIIVVYAGFLWLTAGGNDEQVKKAKKLIMNGVIGLIIALSAFLITSFVVQQVQQAVSQKVSGGGG